MLKLKRAALASVLLAVSLLGVVSAPAMAAKQAESKGQVKNIADPVVLMETTKGPIKLLVYKSEVPTTANNFLDLVKRGFYNGLTFHRYEPGFCIQGGDPKGNGTGGFIDPETRRERCIPLEVKPNLRHDAAGVLAMARSQNPDSASCQFYITLGPANFLDMNYAVFGKVLDGMDAVKALRKGDKMTKVSIVEGSK
jgi:peptidyl-prolyl cis-trans isomerase B (cyclophilin B)